MAIKNQALTITYRAIDTSTGKLVAGDVANHTIYLIRDGVAAAATNSPAEPDGTNAPGSYSIELTAAEMNCDAIEITGVSSTENVEIVGPILTTDQGAIGTLSSSERNAVADALLDRSNGIETGISPRAAMRAIQAILLGRINGVGTSPEVFKDPSGANDRVTVTYDSSHNRTNVVVH